MAFLAVEDERALQVELEGLLRRVGWPKQSASLRREGAAGEARLFRWDSAKRGEMLVVSWDHHQIQRFEVEPLIEARFEEVDAQLIQDAVGEIAPRVWAHLRAGGARPTGADRFAAFFCRV